MSSEQINATSAEIAAAIKNNPERVKIKNRPDI